MRTEEEPVDVDVSAFSELESRVSLRLNWFFLIFLNPIIFRCVGSPNQERSHKILNLSSIVF
jgi:hypothetical protein